MKRQRVQQSDQLDMSTDAILHAVRSGDSEVFVGTSVVQLIFGQLIVPRWLDYKMISRAEMQKSEENQPDNGHNNEFEPFSAFKAGYTVDLAAVPRTPQ